MLVRKWHTATTGCPSSCSVHLVTPACTKARNINPSPSTRFRFLFPTIIIRHNRSKKTSQSYGTNSYLAASCDHGTGNSTGDQRRRRAGLVHVLQTHLDCPRNYHGCPGVRSVGISLLLQKQARASTNLGVSKENESTTRRKVSFCWLPDHVVGLFESEQCALTPSLVSHAQTPKHKPQR